MHNILSGLQHNVILVLLLSKGTQIIFRKPHLPKPIPSPSPRINPNWNKPVRVIAFLLPPVIGLVLDMLGTSGQSGKISCGGILGMFSLLLRRKQRKRRSHSSSGCCVPPGFGSRNCCVICYYPSSEENKFESNHREAEMESGHQGAMSLVFWCIFIICDNCLLLKLIELRCPAPDKPGFRARANSTSSKMLS